MADLRRIIEKHGPFASVCFDSSHDTEDAARQLQLHWHSIDAELESSGARPRMRRLLAQEIERHPPARGRCGRLLIADETEVLADERLPSPPDVETVRVSPLPYLLPLIEVESEQIPHVVAVVDRVGSELYSLDEHGAEFDETLRGADHPVHKVRRGGWSHRTIQQRVEKTTRRNLREFAREVGRLADSVHADIVVLAGEVQARSDLRAEIGAQGRNVIEAESGTLAPNSDPTALDAEVRELLHRAAADRRRQLLDRFAAELGRPAGLAVTGLAGTSSALRAANVERMLLNRRALGDRLVLAGTTPGPLISPATSGWAGEMRRADEALPVAALATDAAITVVDDATPLRDGVGALLRHR
ncbi:Vms1/Ankzf1 family peptidyl-tRNA hydrolase [Nocardia sp. NBC_00508]|uniref:Rv2629 family ribosome hibernation factor n=1 Tax=Nocardia sp. NBC_00508 TaxID=2975992 RepID=UPI002E81D301|nr:Vms1/Ankzf1 family peptidyl-tRNA hydrolase [Nocardia sp. NBC_00508]WUD67297.1 Vms1/Ankzf1 family peptidyl-tRNA hydrolase [Nocardia sp. NBC_00508]